MSAPIDTVAQRDAPINTGLLNRSRQPKQARKSKQRCLLACGRHRSSYCHLHRSSCIKGGFPHTRALQPSAQARGPRERARAERSRARSSLRQTPTRHMGSTKHVGDASDEASRARGVASYARHVPSGTLVCTDSTHGRDANLVLCARAQGGTWFSAHAHGASRW